MGSGLGLDSSFFNVVTTVTGVFMVMAMGALARYLKWFTSEVDKSLAGFTSNVLLPSYFFYRIVSDPKVTNSWDTWTPALYGVSLTAFGFVVAAIVVWAVGRWCCLQSESERRTFILCSGVANYGYIAIPLAEVFYPDCIIALLVHNVGVDSALWSIGLFVISGLGLKNSWKRIVFSPPLLSVATAITIRQLGMQSYVPQPFLHMTSQLGRCSIPMGLVLSGAIIFDYTGRIKFNEAWRPFFLALAVRVFLLPITFLMVAKYGGISRSLQEVLLLQAAMPAATFTIVMTRLYNRSIETALTVAVGTSLLGIVTIPAWLIFGARWLGI